MPYAKNHIRVNVPKRSGFDKSHRNSGTGTCGTLIPLLCDEVIPNTRVHLRVPIAAQMPPLASETYMNVKLKMEAFFVPMRLLCGSFESFFTDFPKRITYAAGSTAVDSFSEARGLLPHLRINTDEIASQNYFPAGSLGDYLGIGTGLIDTDSRGVGINLMPFLAYHKVWEDYYRNPRVQNPAFAPVLRIVDASTPLRISSCPFDFLHDVLTVPGSSYNQAQNYYLVKSDTGALTSDDRFRLADGTNLFSLRQRNFGLDYFTGARVDAQQGDAVSVSVPAPGEGKSETSFSIASLRAANSLQQFRERNNLPSPRLIDQVKARYGAILSDGVAQRPICIGSATMDMYTHGVDQTANDTDSSYTGKNPFNSVAAQYGRASVSGNELLIENFTANEPGYILVLVSQVPEVSYTLGVNPIFRRYLGPGSIVQMANPLLQNMGDQPIYISELNGLVTPNVVDTVFGYQDRFADFMFIKNQIHGLFRAGENLSAFVAQRTIGSNVELSSAFLEIPKTYLDDVLAVSQPVSGLTFWYDSYLDYKVSMPLAEFSIPSLQDPAYEHGESISLRRNGQIF